jgi:hypothetical protein
MKEFFFSTTALLLFTYFHVEGQQLSDSLLTTFYNKTLSDYFEDTTNNQKQIKFGCILVRTNFDTINLVKKVGVHKLKCFHYHTSVLSLINRPLKKNIGRNVYGVSHEVLGQDTVEVNIGGSTIEFISRNKVFMGIWCGGTMGHIPTGRFVFDKATNNWVFNSGKKIQDEMMREFEKQYFKER